MSGKISNIQPQVANGTTQDSATMISSLKPTNVQQISNIKAKCPTTDQMPTEPLSANINVDIDEFGGSAPSSINSPLNSKNAHNQKYNNTSSSSSGSASQLATNNSTIVGVGLRTGGVTCSLPLGQLSNATSLSMNPPGSSLISSNLVMSNVQQQQQQQQQQQLSMSSYSTPQNYNYNSDLFNYNPNASTSTNVIGTSITNAFNASTNSSSRNSSSSSASNSQFASTLPPGINFPPQQTQQQQQRQVLNSAGFINNRVVPSTLASQQTLLNNQAQYSVKQQLNSLTIGTSQIGNNGENFFIK